jgi:MerR family transcriptional regulator, light-induced transcriptional regulator
MDEVERFQRSLSEGLPAGSDAWVDLLSTTDRVPLVIQEHLLTERRRLGSWTATATALAPVLEELGRRWADARISIFEEHLASERLARALARCAESMPVDEHAPRILLATAEGEEHTLGLSLLEVVAAEAGAITLWMGRDTPARALVDALADGAADVLAVSASRLREPQELAREARELIQAAVPWNVRIAFGGSGRWPPQPPSPHARIEDFGAFRVWLRSRAALHS